MQGGVLAEVEIERNGVGKATATNSVRQLLMSEVFDGEAWLDRGGRGSDMAWVLLVG
jgi:hypothetical protein